MRVLIKILNQNEVINISADDEVGKVIVNGKEVEFESGYFIHRVVVITSSWEEKLINNNIFDGLSYKIKLVNSDYELIDKAKGKETVILPKFSNHNLRHTFITRMCEAGVNIKEMQDILGHADAETTMDIYADATQDFKRSEMIGFEDLFKSKSHEQLLLS